LCQLECLVDDAKIACYKAEFVEFVFVGECEFDGFAGLLAELGDVEECGLDGFLSLAF